MVNQAKSMATEEFSSMIDKKSGKNTVGEKTMNGNNLINGNAKARVSLFVKVNMDGIPIGRKVDLSAHSCYETLAQTLEDMFLEPMPAINSKREFSYCLCLLLLERRRFKIVIQYLHYQFIRNSLWFYCC